MPVLTDVRTSLPQAQDVAASLSQARWFLLGHLSSGGGTWYASRAPMQLPASMLRRRSFVETDESSELHVIDVIPVDEAADEW